MKRFDWSRTILKTIIYAYWRIKTHKSPLCRIVCLHLFHELEVYGFTVPRISKASLTWSSSALIKSPTIMDLYLVFRWEYSLVQNEQMQFPVNFIPLKMTSYFIIFIWIKRFNFVLNGRLWVKFVTDYTKLDSILLSFTHYLVIILPW